MFCLVVDRNIYFRDRKIVFDSYDKRLLFSMPCQHTPMGRSCKTPSLNLMTQSMTLAMEILLEQMFICKLIKCLVESMNIID